MKVFRLTHDLALCSISLGSCLKQNYDNPPDLSTFDPNLPVNLKIRDLVSPYWGLTTNPYRTLGDSTIYGIVVADDRSGNFYKQIIIEDSTGAINVSIDNTYLYNDYPIGRKVYIKLKGLILIDYKGSPELAYTVTGAGPTVTGIPSTLQDSFVIAASYPNTVTPYECRLTDITSFPYPYINMLLKLDDMEFDTTALNLPYAVASSIAVSTSRQIDGCLNGNSLGVITLYNSGYANFYNAIPPSGYGTITGIFTVYGSTNQFQIRDTTDVNMPGSRCN